MRFTITGKTAKKSRMRFSCQPPMSRRQFKHTDMKTAKVVFIRNKIGNLYFSIIFLAYADRIP
jgi:hypothetical protein